MSNRSCEGSREVRVCRVSPAASVCGRSGESRATGLTVTGGCVEMEKEAGLGSGADVRRLGRGGPRKDCKAGDGTTRRVFVGPAGAVRGCLGAGAAPTARGAGAARVGSRRGEAASAARGGKRSAAADQPGERLAAGRRPAP